MLVHAMLCFDVSLLHYLLEHCLFTGGNPFNGYYHGNYDPISNMPGKRGPADSDEPVTTPRQKCSADHTAR